VRRLGVVAIVALASALVLAIAALARVAQDPNPAASYPANPRTVNGKDPYSVLPKPQECSPSRDHGTTADYFRLSRLPQRRGDNPFAPGAPATTVVTLVNKKGQTFRIYISSGSTAVVSRYIKLVSACAEAITLKVADPAVLVPVFVSAHLVDAAVAKTGKSVSALSALRDSLASSGASLAAVVTAAGGVIGDVLATAIQATTADLSTRVAAGDLTAAEVASLNVPNLINDLANQAGAPFLSPPGDDPRTPAERSKFLSTHPRTAIVVGIVPVSTTTKPLPKRYVGWAAFDFARGGSGAGAQSAAAGSLAYGAYDNYIAKCQKAASSQITAWVGSAKLKMWRVSDWQNYASSSAASGPSPRLYASTGTLRTYDTWVKGTAYGVNSTYSMYYGWVKGSGGGC
jgi:hypothetical protein